MNLPTQYQWLKELKGLPNTIKFALAEYGVQEIVGKGNNKTIMAWRDELNLAGVKIAGFSSDEIAWCGLFSAIVTYRRNKKPSEVVKDPLWARNWTHYGVKATKAALGDVLVFTRPSGGHVGFYVGEDEDCYHVLGGNQSNRVTIMRVGKARCIAIRRPPYITIPQGVKMHALAASGMVSSNET